MSIGTWIKRLFTASSNVPKRGAPMALTEDEFHNSLRDFLGVQPDVQFSDSTYSIVQKEWLIYAWYEYFEKVLDGLKITGWKSNFDCDNFALLYLALIQACHTKANAKTEGIAVGMIWFESDSIGGHAVNIALTDKGWVCVEPQNGAEMILSVKEKQSCWFAYF